VSPDRLAQITSLRSLQSTTCAANRARSGVHQSPVGAGDVRILLRTVPLMLGTAEHVANDAYRHVRLWRPPAPHPQPFARSQCGNHVLADLVVRSVWLATGACSHPQATTCRAGWIADHEAPVGGPDQPRTVEGPTRDPLAGRRPANRGFVGSAIPSGRHVVAAAGCRPSRQHTLATTRSGEDVGWSALRRPREWLGVGGGWSHNLTLLPRICARWLPCSAVQSPDVRSRILTSSSTDGD